MKQVLLRIHHLGVQTFDPLNSKARMKITYSVDNQTNSVTKEFVLNKPEPLVNDIFTFVKQQGNVDMSNVDDFVAGLFVKTLVDEEKVEEILLNFFSRLCEHARIIKKEKNHATYMKLFDEIKISELKL